MWVREVDGGILWEVARVVLALAGAGAGVRVWVAARMPDGRAFVEVLSALGFGVML